MNKVIIIEESLAKSVVKDITTFAMFAGLMYFNHAYLAGYWIIDVLFIGCVILFLIGRSSSQIHKFRNELEAIEYLKGTNQ